MLPVSHDVMTYDIMMYDVMTYDVVTYDVIKYDVMTYDVITYDIMPKVEKKSCDIYRKIFRNIVLPFNKKFLYKIVVPMSQFSILVYHITQVH